MKKKKPTSKDYTIAIRDLNAKADFLKAHLESQMYWLKSYIEFKGDKDTYVKYLEDMEKLKENVDEQKNNPS